MLALVGDGEGGEVGERRGERTARGEVADKGGISFRHCVVSRAIPSFFVGRLYSRFLACAGLLLGRSVNSLQIP